MLQLLQSLGGGMYPLRYERILIFPLVRFRQFNSDLVLEYSPAPADLTHNLAEVLLHFLMQSL